MSKITIFQDTLKGSELLNLTDLINLDKIETYRLDLNNASIASYDDARIQRGQIAKRVFGNNCSVNEQGKHNVTLFKSSHFKIFFTTTISGIDTVLDKIIEFDRVKNANQVHLNTGSDSSEAGIPIDGTLEFKNKEALPTKIQKWSTRDEYAVEVIYDTEKGITIIGIMLHCVAEVNDSSLFTQNENYTTVNRIKTAKRKLSDNI